MKCYFFTFWKSSCELLVLFHVAFENVIKRSKQASKSGSVKTEAIHITCGQDASCANIISEQSSFSEIFAGTVLHDFSLGTVSATLDSLGSSLTEHVEHVASRALPDDIVTLVEMLFAHSIAKFASFVRVHRLENRDSL